MIEEPEKRTIKRSPVPYLSAQIPEPEMGARGEVEKIKSAMAYLNRTVSERDQQEVISFDEFLQVLAANPSAAIRNIFQVFHDMVMAYVGEGIGEYTDDPESIRFVCYNCNRLFVEGVDRPFFADRLFAGRLIRLAEAFRRGAQQNKIHIFRGPPGSGKSTFLNNLLMRIEEYANSKKGTRYETVWRLQRKMLGTSMDQEASSLFGKGFQRVDGFGQDQKGFFQGDQVPDTADDYVEVPCPSHDNPILMIPKPYRRAFFDEILKNDEFKWRLSAEKEYDWVFRENPCTICTSLYHALLNKLKSPMKVFEMIYARPYRLNRRLGEGISVFNPGDKPLKDNILTNDMLQRRIDWLLKDSNQVKYLFSQYAKTNNGVYALMDIKGHNPQRLIELHNIISEGVHKVEDIEENVHSLLLAVMNPEDKKNIEEFQSFSDRIEYINIPYVMDLSTEVEIYRNIFGRHIDQSFLPMVLQNFARVIVSSRLSIESEALSEWIEDPEKYSLYCDENLQLLKMELYRGKIPTWLSDEDRKRFTPKSLGRVIKESETEGDRGISGRDAIKLFNEFYSTYAKEGRLINMATLRKFFKESHEELNPLIPEGFLDSVLRMYDYTVLQEVKESLYYYNEEQISRDIQNYLFAINFEPGSVETCTFSGEKLETTDAFFESVERRLLGPKTGDDKRHAFRKETQKEYTSKALTQEMGVEGRAITETGLYQSLHERYIHNLKEKALDPFLENENFRRGIKEFDTEAFKTYDKRIRHDVTFLMKNLSKNYHYSKQGAKEVCIYVIDNDLAKKFEDP